MAAMQDLEEFIKEIIADVLAKSFGTDPENYLKFSNFRDRKTSNTRFSLKSVLRKAKKGLSSDKEPIKHYREKYGCIPPWILFKSVYFSTAQTQFRQNGKRRAGYSDRRGSRRLSVNHRAEIAMCRGKWQGRPS